MKETNLLYKKIFKKFEVKLLYTNYVSLYACNNFSQMKFIHDMAVLDQAYPETGYWWLGLTHLGE